ncbi:hypothetical protein DMUE_3881 [Dictyocoela muelleri]|nr:hypothetical protein DMUE_3881 [Dictyocoela muelleri]
MLLISDFSYELGHIKGENNQIADYLSRSCIVSEVSKNERCENPFKLENLKRIGIENKTSNKIKFRILNEFKHEFIKSAHKFLGHPSISKLYNTLKNIFIIENSELIISQVTTDCQKCNLNKDFKTNKGITIGGIKSQVPFESISMDICGPFNG